MSRVLTAVVLIPLVIVALFKAPLWLFTLLVLGVALLAAREYLDIATATGFKPFRALGYLFLDNDLGEDSLAAAYWPLYREKARAGTHVPPGGLQFLAPGRS